MNVEDIVNEKLQKIQTQISEFTYPIFTSSNEKPDLLATGVIIQFERKIYLVTAAHVICEIESSKSSFYLGTTNGQFQKIKGPFILSTKNEYDSDHFDIAYTELSNDFVESHGIKFLPSTNINLSTAIENNSLAFINGYPCSKNKQSKSLIKGKRNYGKDNHFSLTPRGYNGLIRNIDETTYIQNNKVSNCHTALIYQRDNDRLCDPLGYSGCGLWIESKDSKLLLDSICIENFAFENKSKIIYATKMKHVLGFIKASESDQEYEF